MLVVSANIRIYAVDAARGRHIITKAIIWLPNPGAHTGPAFTHKQSPVSEKQLVIDWQTLILEEIDL